jgi:hypothetical protein
MRALAKGADGKARRRFFEALLRAKLIVPSPELEAGAHPVDAEHRLLEPATINIVGTTAPDGSRGLIALTSEAALLAWRPVGCPYAELPARDVFAMALRGGFGSLVLNPSGPAGGFVKEDELRALAEGQVPGGPIERQRLGRGTEIAMGAPVRPVPPGLLEEVRAQAEARPEVRGAWIVQLAVGDDAPHLCVVLEHAPGANPETFVPPLMAAVEAVLPPGEAVDCLPQPTGGSILPMARTTVPPAYLRG